MRVFFFNCSFSLRTYREHPIGYGLKRNLFFLVTNIEYDIVPGRQGAVPDTYTGASAGELGCWVDCQNTRILQVGIEQSGIPGCWNIGKFCWILRPISSKTLQETVPGFHVMSPPLEATVFEGYTESSKSH